MKKKLKIIPKFKITPTIAVGIVIIIVVTEILFSEFRLTAMNITGEQETEQTATPEPNISESPSATPSPTPKPIVKTTPKPTTAPTPLGTPVYGSLAQTPTPTACDSYDLGGNTSDIIVTGILSSGGDTLEYTPNVKITTNGCLALDGGYIDHLSKWMPLYMPQVIFNNVPPGPYTVEITYRLEPLDSKSVNVESGSPTIISFIIPE